MNESIRGKKTRRVRRIAAAAAVLLLISVCGESCFAADWTKEPLRAGIFQAGPLRAEPREADERNALHLIAVNIPETEKERGSLEVSLQAAAGSCVKTAGILLEYDYSKLRPVGWEREEGECSVPDLSEPPQEAWRKAEVVPSKCPPGITGKPALSFRRGNKGYLYMAAEQEKPRALAEGTLLVTVRFAYARGAVPSKDYVASALNFAESRASLADAYYSPVKGSVYYQSGSPETGAVQSFCHKALERTGSGAVREDTSVPAEQRLDSSVNLFTYVPDGESVEQRPSEQSDYVSVTFYDWDGTLLGSRIAVRGQGLTDPNLPEARGNYVEADGTPKYTDEELTAMGAAPLVPEGNLLTGGRDQDGNLITSVNKAGYTFAGWVDYEAASTPEVGITDRNLNQINPDSLVPLSGMAEPRILRAAYHETGVSTGSNAERRYDIYWSPFRYSENKQFLEVTLTAVRREHARRINGNVLLLVSLRPIGAGETRLKIELGQADVQSYVLQMPPGAADKYTEQNAISCTVWDREGVTRGNGINIPSKLITADR